MKEKKKNATMNVSYKAEQKREKLGNRICALRKNTFYS